MSKSKKSPFDQIVDSTPALAAAARLAQVLPKKVSSLDQQVGKAINDEVARFDAQVDSSR